MRLSLQTDYALRTLMYLAAHEGQHSITKIAGHYAISKNHLMKVAQRLAAEGFVDSVRGRSGGLLLNQPADSIEAFLRHLDGFTIADLGGDKARFRSVWE